MSKGLLAPCGEAFFIMLDQNAVAVVDFVLMIRAVKPVNVLTRGFHGEILVAHLDGVVASRVACPQLQAAFFRFLVAPARETSRGSAWPGMHLRCRRR